METIKIFLASSEELDYYRMAFGNLVRRLDNMYEKRGVRIKLFEWEDYDASYNDRRKQDEYNDFARKSDLFIALFYTKANKFTVEEFNVALDEYKHYNHPKIYVYCKDLQKKEPSTELIAFKKKLSEEMGHCWCRYDNRESMQFHFVMQLQLMESNWVGEMRVQDGNITLDGLQVAKMDKLLFAATNEDYLKMSEELSKLPEKIENARLRLYNDPDDEDLINDLQDKLDRYNKLKEDFSTHQQLLFQTAKRVARLQGEMITKRTHRAMDALNEGKVRYAIEILEIAEEDANRNLNDYKQSKVVTEQKRQNVIFSIEELLLKASSVMADASILIENRISKAEKIYAQAEEMAHECLYDKKKYIDLLFDYDEFLGTFALYDKALKVAEKLIQLCEETYGSEHPRTASSYDMIGSIYKEQGDYTNALNFHLKAVSINEKVLGKEHQNTASSYNNIGIALDEQGKYNEAIEFEQKAIEICEKGLGFDHPDTGKCYENIGGVYFKLGDYSHALDYYLKALAIFEKKHGKEHHATATSYDSIGLAYFGLGNYEKALEYHFKALVIQEKTLGLEHPLTASTLNNIGSIYWTKKDYPEALEYFLKAIGIREKTLGFDHPDTATTYSNIGSIFYKIDEYAKALEYYLKALDIYEKVVGFDHPDTATLYNNIGNVFFSQNNYAKALEYYHKDLAISGKLLGLDHPDIATTYSNIGRIFYKQNNYKKALEYYLKALRIREKVLGPEHLSTANLYDKIGSVYEEQEKYSTALKYFLKANAIYEKVFGKEHPTTNVSYKTISSVYSKLGKKAKAQEYIDKVKNSSSD